MSLLRSKAARIYLSQAANPPVDLTEPLRSWKAPDAVITSWAASTDAIYIGRPHKFNNRYISMGAANADQASLIVEYWNGSTWNSFTDLDDETNGFKSSGFIAWEEKPEWVKAPSTALPALASLGHKEMMFWIRLRLSANSISGFTVGAIKMLLSDDRSMQAIHPEVMQYLPSGQADFLPQHELAKDSIVAEMIRKGVISYEEQIKDIEQWMLAASYKCVSVILSVIPGDKNLAAVAEAMDDAYDKTRPELAATIDTNKNEIADASEKEQPWQGSISLVRR